jgi:type IV secretion system protein VirD4
MYQLSRLMLILSVIGGCGCLVAVAASFGGPGLIAIPVVLIAVAMRKLPQAFTAHGTARWATLKDLRYAGMVGAHRGLIIGRTATNTKTPLFKAINDLFRAGVPSKEACEQFFDSMRHFNRKRRQSELISLPNAVHTAVFAPTGVGKGVSCVVPFLMTSRESAVVVDFKGENYRLTAAHRQKVFGHKIVVLDPFKVVTQAPNSFNALDFIDKDSPTALDECRDLAEALVIRTGQEKDPHWVDSAEAWISALTALVVHYGEPNDRSLQTVRTLLASPEKLEMAIKLMGSSDAWDGMLARMGNQLTHYKDKELNSVMTTTGRFLRFLDTLAISESTKSSNFNPAELRKGKMTVYLILPPEHMRAQSPLLRMWIGSLLRAVVREGLQ